MTEVSEMIEHIYRMLEQRGVAIDKSTRDEVSVSFRQEYGGERVYIAHQPKRRHQVQAAKAAAKVAREVATVAGISERHARRILRGK